MSTDDVRPEVAAFALLMERKLRENDHKGGWQSESTAYLSRRCGNELKELREALAALHRDRMRGWPPIDASKRAKLIATIGREAADVANFAMMLADVSGALLTEGDHEANRAYCESIGDTSQLAWEQAPDWQKDSARAGVRAVLSGEAKTPEEQHQSWMRMKLDDGWTFGEHKDADRKTHPCRLLDKASAGTPAPTPSAATDVPEHPRHCGRCLKPMLDCECRCSCRHLWHEHPMGGRCFNSLRCLCRGFDLVPTPSASPPVEQAPPTSLYEFAQQGGRLDRPEQAVEACGTCGGARTVCWATGMRAEICPARSSPYHGCTWLSKACPTCNGTGKRPTQGAAE